MILSCWIASLIFAACQVAPPIKALEFHKTIWEVTSQSVYKPFGLNLPLPADFPKHRQLEFCKDKVEITYQSACDKPITAIWKAKPIRSTSAGVHIELLDSDGDVRFTILCKRTKVSILIAINLSSDSVPRGFDTSVDNIVLLKCNQRE